MVKNAVPIQQHRTNHSQRCGSTARTRTLRPSGLTAASFLLDCATFDMLLPVSWKQTKKPPRLAHPMCRWRLEALQPDVFRICKL
ncbi:hypothetical protein RRG08_023522 [Elysia crispata]|uniref:Uncharacterized protein n=1 Tax=Elysia crispata TaxID=231223 RepID=A0AAE1D6N9_9GAST|nr:hypothetical protein RRG08_023522 [Elysia crispata]